MINDAEEGWWKEENRRGGRNLRPWVKGLFKCVETSSKWRKLLMVRHKGVHQLPGRRGCVRVTVNLIKYIQVIVDERQFFILTTARSYHQLSTIHGSRSTPRPI